MDINKTNDLLTNGIASDTFIADLNYHVFRKIHNRYSEISKLEKLDRAFFNYLLSNAKEKTILHLAKIFDTKSKYETRCLSEVIKILRENNQKITENVFTRDNWIDFKNKYKLIFDYAEFNSDVNINNFIDYFNRVFTKIKKSPSYKNLKLWRDKILAHNEKYDSTNLNIDYPDIEFLLLLPKAIIEFTNQFVHTESTIFPINAETDTYFIENLLYKYIG